MNCIYILVNWLGFDTHLWAVRFIHLWYVCADLLCHGFWRTGDLGQQIANGDFSKLPRYSEMINELPLFRILTFCLCLIAGIPAAGLDKHGNWTTVPGNGYENCSFCRTLEFHNERRVLARQNGSLLNSSGTVGYVVGKRSHAKGGLHTYGRMTLVGLGDIGTTAAHVLFDTEGNIRASDNGKLYFQPVLEPSVLIEIDLSTIEAGRRGRVNTVRYTKMDWANVYLKRDVFRVTSSKYIFSLLWNFRLDDKTFNSEIYRRSMNYFFSVSKKLQVDKSCTRVVQDSPSRYKFDSPDIFFSNCPTLVTQKGASGTAFSITWNDGSKHLAGQIVSNESDITADGLDGDGKVHTTPQIVLGLTPARLKSLNRMYFKRLRQRGLF